MQDLISDFKNHPKLYLNHYFIELRHQLDLFYVRQAFNETDCYKKEISNQIWLKSIEKVNLFEMECLKRKNGSRNLVDLFLNRTICVLNTANNKIKLLIITDEFVSDVECLLFGDFKVNGILTANKLKLNELKHHIQNLKQIDEISLAIKSVEVVKLQFNKINSIDPFVFKEFTHLKDLNLSSNRLTHIAPATFNGLFSLRTLHLANNKLSELDARLFNDLHRLETLTLNLNRINRIHTDTFNSLIHLKHLDLSYNNIKVIQAHTFTCNACLEELKLSLNEIDAIHAEMFEGLINLKSLHLDTNRIQTIENNSFENLSKISS